MAMLTIRNIDESLKIKLKMMAAQQGVSMEEQARRILRNAVQPDSHKKGLGSRIHHRFTKVDGMEFEQPERSPARPAPDFSD